MDGRFILLFSILAVAQVYSAMVKKCPGKPADILFILDESRSIWYKHFEMQVNFVHSLADEFKIDPSKVRIGVISFSSKVFLQWGLDKYSNKESLLAAIDGLKQAYGDQTNTHLALAKARETLNQQRRPGIPMIVILMTDGQSRHVSLTAEEGSKLRSQNATVFAIGVGHNVNKKELEGIATDKDHVILTSFEKLNDQLRDRLVTASCEYLGNPMGECDLDIETDLAFVLGSINQNPQGAKEAMGFVKRIIQDDNMFIGPDSVQVGLVPKDCIPIGFDLNTYPDKEMAMTHFDFAAEAFETTADHINYMTQHTFSPANGAREGVRKVAAVILDRESPDVEATIRAIEEAKAQGVEVIAIGVGNQVNNNELKRIASDPSMAFNVKDYNQLYELKKDVLYNFVCP